MIPAFGEPLIVFESNRVGNNYDIYLLDLATREEKRLTDNSAIDRWPSWSPNGRQIVFVSARDGNTEIYVMDHDGRNQRNLTNNPGVDQRTGIDWEPSWSPDGSKIAFSSFRDGDLAGGIYVMNADGTNLRKLTKGLQPSWSPDGKQIAFVSAENGISKDIYIMNSDGTNVRNLTNHPSEDRYPAWSPDGQKIVFRSTRVGGDKFGLFIQEIESGKVKRLSVPFNLPENLSWAPDSKKILFNNNHPESQLYLVNIETEKIETIAPMPGAYNGHPRWFDSKFFSVTVRGKLPSIWGNIKAQSLFLGK